MNPQTKITKITQTVKITRLYGEDLLHIFRLVYAHIRPEAKGITEIIFTVPSGADYSGMDLNFLTGDDIYLEIRHSYTETTEE